MNTWLIVAALSTYVVLGTWRLLYVTQVLKRPYGDRNDDVKDTVLEYFFLPVWIILAVLLILYIEVTEMVLDTCAYLRNRYF